MLSMILSFLNYPRTPVAISQSNETINSMIQNLQNEINKLSHIDFEGHTNITLSPENMIQFADANINTIENLCKKINMHAVEILHFTGQLDRIVMIEGQHLRINSSILLLKCTSSILKLYDINLHAREFLWNIELLKKRCIERIKIMERLTNNGDCICTPDEKQELINEINNFRYMIST